MTLEGTRFDAVPVEGHERGAVRSYVLAQRYIPAGRLRKLQTIGNPAALGSHQGYSLNSPWLARARDPKPPPGEDAADEGRRLLRASARLDVLAAQVTGAEIATRSTDGSAVTIGTDERGSRGDSVQ
jgi:hypothetical protein